MSSSCRKIFNFKSEILEKETFEKYGYYPSALGGSSNKFIVATCRFCGKEHDLRKAQFVKNNSACHKECKIQEMRQQKSPFLNKEVRDKAKKTNLKRYGTEIASKNKDIKHKISETRKTENVRTKIKQTTLKKYGVENVFESDEVKEKIKQTNLEKYGVEYPNKNAEILNKTKRTNLEKYGTECVLNNQEIQKQIRQTNLKKFGYENPSKNNEVKQKIIDTNLEKYGVTAPIQNSDIKQKVQDTNLERYGCVSPFGDRSVQKKTKETNLSRYGVENVFKSNDIIEGIKKSNLEKYGVEYPFQSSDIQDKIVQTIMDIYGVDNVAKHYDIKKKISESLKEYIKNNLNNNFNTINTLRSQNFWDDLKDSTLSEICDKYNLNYGSLTNQLNSSEFKGRYNECYTYPTHQTQSAIKDILISYGFDVEFNTRKIISPYELDIYIPSKKFAIEFNGSYWHSEEVLGKNARRKHIDKTLMCRELGIRLFHIFEHTWYERSSQLLNFIKTILGCNLIKIGARKCVINNDEVKSFLNDNHIQGYGNGTIKFFNLEYNGEIMASMTASKHHRQNGFDKCVVLNRLCFKDGFSVQGGASKLFKEFVSWAKECGYEKIVSWSDNCWTDGNIYKVLGFDMDSESDPDYFYFDKLAGCYRSKQSQKKSCTGCPPYITEREWAISRGLYRIYDSGKRRWIYNL